MTLLNTYNDDTPLPSSPNDKTSFSGQIDIKENPADEMGHDQQEGSVSLLDATVREFSEYLMRFPDAIETVCDTVSDAIPVVRIVSKAVSIPDQLFMRKVKKLIEDTARLSNHKAVATANKASIIKAKSETYFIFNIIQNIEEEEKIPHLAIILSNYLSQNINQSQYRRLSLLVQRTFSEDLDYLTKHYSELSAESFPLSDSHRQGLLSSGWLLYDGESWGDESTSIVPIYSLTNDASSFIECKSRYMRSL